MNIATKTRSARADSLDAIADDLFHPLGAKGVYARTAKYEKVISALAALISGMGDADAEVFRFPPVMSRWQAEKSGYLGNFPNLLGCVCALQGPEASIRKAIACIDETAAWTDSLSATDLVLNPAACYPVYALAAEKGVVPAQGWRFDVAADCFRREPSTDLDRLQSFRMREFVRIGSPEQVMRFREDWMARAPDFAAGLGLSCEIVIAHDPFFGRGAQLLAASQKEQSLKFELLVPIHSAQRPTACLSFNYHLDHFGEAWALRDASGKTAHSGCVAFGMDRLALALFRQHGLDLEDWPEHVRKVLGF